MAKENRTAKFLVQPFDSLHRIVVSGMERLFFCGLIDSKSLVVVVVEGVESVSIICHYLKQCIGFVVRQ